MSFSIQFSEGSSSPRFLAAQTIDLSVKVTSGTDRSAGNPSTLTDCRRAVLGGLLKTLTATGSPWISLRRSARGPGREFCSTAATTFHGSGEAHRSLCDVYLPEPLIPRVRISGRSTRYSNAISTVDQGPAPPFHFRMSSRFDHASMHYHRPFSTTHCFDFHRTGNITHRHAVRLLLRRQSFRSQRCKPRRWRYLATTFSTKCSVTRRSFPHPRAASPAL